MLCLRPPVFVKNNAIALLWTVASAVLFTGATAGPVAVSEKSVTSGTRRLNIRLDPSFKKRAQKAFPKITTLTQAEYSNIIVNETKGFIPPKPQARSEQMAPQTQPAPHSC